MRVDRALRRAMFQNGGIAASSVIERGALDPPHAFVTNIYHA